jgi:hypothetical protein
MKIFVGKNDIIVKLRNVLVFHSNKSGKTYPRTILPPGGRNWKLIKSIYVIFIRSFFTISRHC